MKFCPYLAPDSLDLLNLRVIIRAASCRHCQCSESVVAHGYRRGLAESGNDIVTRGLRFFARTAIRTQAAAGRFRSTGTISCPTHRFDPPSLSPLSEPVRPRPRVILRSKSTDSLIPTACAISTQRSLRALARWPPSKTASKKPPAVKTAIGWQYAA